MLGLVLLTAHFRAIYVADNQLHSPRARYVLECNYTLAYKHRMADDQDRFMDRLFSPPGGGKPKPKHKDIRGFLVSRPRAAAEAAAEPGRHGKVHR
eukprot:364818-Chlamydomonas_euryale.AAC.5